MTQTVPPTINFPEELAPLESHFKSREPRQRQSSHCERWGSAGRLADQEARKRWSMEAHGFGSLHSLGAGHPETMDYLYSLAGTLERRGRIPEAEAVMRHVLEGRLEALGAGNAMADLARRRLRELVLRQGRRQEAEELAEQIEHPGFVMQRTLQGNGLRGGAAPRDQAPAPEAWKRPARRPPPTTLREFGQLLASSGREADAVKAGELMRRSQEARQKLMKGNRKMLDFADLKHGGADRSSFLLQPQLSRTLDSGNNADEITRILREASTASRAPPMHLGNLSPGADSGTVARSSRGPEERFRRARGWSEPRIM